MLEKDKFITYLRFAMIDMAMARSLDCTFECFFCVTKHFFQIVIFISKNLSSSDIFSHCYSEISDFSSRRAEFGRLAVLGWTENLPEPLDGVTV